MLVLVQFYTYSPSDGPAEGIHHTHRLFYVVHLDRLRVYPNHMWGSTVGLHSEELHFFLLLRHVQHTCEPTASNRPHVHAVRRLFNRTVPFHTETLVSRLSQLHGPEARYICSSSPPLHHASCYRINYHTWSNSQRGNWRHRPLPNRPHPATSIYPVAL